MAESEGASEPERFIDACRRNNTDQLGKVLDACESDEARLDLINNSRSVLGNYGYHEAALLGNLDVIDILLDQPGFECDPLTRQDRNTPLHVAMDFINGLAENENNRLWSQELLSLMMSSGGSDPYAKNRYGDTPMDRLDRRRPAMREFFATLVAEYDEALRLEREDEFLQREAIRNAKIMERDKALRAVREAADALDANSASDQDEPGVEKVEGSHLEVTNTKASAPHPPASSGNAAPSMAQHRRQISDAVDDSDSDFDIQAFRRERERLKGGGSGGVGDGNAPQGMI